MSRESVLYISYDGMLEPLGQSQVLAYLERLARDFDIYLISFEKPVDWCDASRRTMLGRRLTAAGIAWHPLAYHKSPTVPATLYDVAQGVAVALRLIVRHRVRVIHARSFVAALIGLIAKRAGGARLVFDMRGLWADERVDGGLWPAGGRLWAWSKRLERILLGAADHIVTLTHASRPIVAGLAPARHAPITVIPTCADLARFTPGQPPTGPVTLGYAGSIGTWYLFDEVLAIFAIVRRRLGDARLLVVNRHDHEQIRSAVTQAQIPPEAVEIVAAEHVEVPALVRRMTAGAAIVRPTPSKIASAPTKLAEYLGCGVPCLGNSGVGDMEETLEREKVGVALREFTPAAREEAVDRLLALCADEDTARRCRQVAEAHFSVDRGVAAYGAIYRDLLG